MMTTSHSSNLESSQSNPRQPAEHHHHGYGGPSAGTLSELKHKRVQERNQLPPLNSGASPRMDGRGAQMRQPLGSNNNNTESQQHHQNSNQVANKPHFHTNAVTNNQNVASNKNYGSQSHQQLSTPSQASRTNQSHLASPQATQLISNSLADAAGYPRMSSSTNDLTSSNSLKQQQQAFSNSVQLPDNNTGSLRDQDLIAAEKHKKNKKSCKVM